MKESTEKKGDGVGEGRKGANRVENKKKRQRAGKKRTGNARLDTNRDKYKQMIGKASKRNMQVNSRHEQKRKEKSIAWQRRTVHTLNINKVKQSIARTIT